jgi:hypothetical protein
VGDSSDNQQETLEFIHSMLGQLRTMAEGAHWAMLAYLIQMASVEAADLRERHLSGSGPDK